MRYPMTEITQKSNRYEFHPSRRRRVRILSVETSCTCVTAFCFCGFRVNAVAGFDLVLSPRPVPSPNRPQHHSHLQYYFQCPVPPFWLGLMTMSFAPLPATTATTATWPKAETGIGARQCALLACFCTCAELESATSNDPGQRANALAPVPSSTTCIRNKCEGVQGSISSVEGSAPVWLLVQASWLPWYLSMVVPIVRK